MERNLTPEILTEIIGKDATKTLISLFGGCRVVFPDMVNLDKFERNIRIYNAIDAGVSCPAIAERFAISVRTAQRMKAARQRLN